MQTVQSNEHRGSIKSRTFMSIEFSRLHLLLLLQKSFLGSNQLYVCIVHTFKIISGIEGINYTDKALFCWE